jgi:hypothetical protein
MMKSFHEGNEPEWNFKALLELDQKSECEVFCTVLKSDIR